MRKFLIDLLNSLNTDKGGFSARKLSAFAAMITAIYLAVQHTTPENLDSVIFTFLLYAATCLGLVTAAQIISAKTGSTVTTSEDSRTTTISQMVTGEKKEGE